VQRKHEIHHDRVTAPSATSKESMLLNNEILDGMDSHLPNREIPLHKELGCTNLACTNPHCNDITCGAFPTPIEVRKSDPDIYSSRYSLDTAVVHGKLFLVDNVIIKCHNYYTCTCI
jgi:hypothetical protein